MSSLNTQTKFVSMVLTRIDNLDIKKLEEWFSINCDVWSYIVHDKDVYENGLLKDKHIHVVCEMKNCRQRLITILSMISSFCGLAPISISIQKTQCTEGALQYLIHKNDTDKHQYLYNEIKTSMSQDDLLNFLSADNTSLSTDRLVEVCKKSIELQSTLYIIKTIGIGYYSKYRNVINDIVDELKLMKYGKQFLKRRSSRNEY